MISLNTIKRARWQIGKGVFIALMLPYLLFPGGFYTLIAHAQSGVPRIISYQGRLLDSGGSLLGGSGGTTYYFKFSIWDDATVGSGTQLWPTSGPSSFATTVTSGVFNVDVGDTAGGFPHALDYNFNTDQDIYLQIEVSSDDSTFETLEPRQRVASAAFAQVAASVSGTTTPSSFGTTTPIASSQVSIEATSTTAIGLSIRGASGQTANLFQIQDSAAANLFFANSSGALFASSTLQVTDNSIFYGTLGIATTTPSGTLGVQGNALISGTTTLANLIATGTTRFNGVTYTWPSADGTANYVLATDGAGTLSWKLDATGAGGSGLFSTTTDSLAVYPTDTADVLIVGGSATTSEGHILEVIGSSLFDAISASGIATLDGGFISAASSTASAGLIVSGSPLQASTTLLVQDLATFDSGFISSASSTVDGALTSSGLVTANTGFVSQASSTVSGAFNVDGLLQASSTILVGGTGTSTFSGEVNTAGLASSNGLTVTGGNFLSSGLLTVTNTGTSTFSGGISAAGLSTSNGLTVTGGTSIVGTITSGTWQGGAIGAAYGGTGIDTSGSTGVPVIDSGTWSASTTLGVPRGGTGVASYATGDLLYGESAATLNKLAAGSEGQVLTIASGIPSWTSTTTVTGSGSANLVARFTGESTLGTGVLTDTGTLVGVGSTTPFALLGVQGNIFTEGDITTGDLTATGTVSTDALAVTGTATTSFSGGISAAGLATSDGLTVTGGTSILGTVTGGTWQGTEIGEIYGGTNQTSYTTGDILYASAGNTLSKLGIGSVGQILTIASGIPSWTSTTTVTGSGTRDLVARWTGESTLGSGIIFDNGDVAGIGTTTPDVRSVATIGATSTTANILTLKGTSGQTGDALVLQDSASSTLFTLNALGGFLGSASSTITGGSLQVSTTTSQEPGIIGVVASAIDLPSTGSTEHIGIKGDYNINQSADSSRNFGGLRVDVTDTSLFDTGAVYGILGTNLRTGSSTGDLYGTYYTTSLSGSGSGTTSSVTGHVVVTSASAASTSALTGLHVSMTTNGGANVTDLYGLRIDQTLFATPENVWGIHQTNSSANNYFAGEFFIGGTSEADSNIFLGNDGAAVFNEQSSNVDFRVEGNNVTDLLFVDGSADSVGIGTSTPSQTLALQGSALFSGDLNLANLTATGTVQADTALRVATTTTSTGKIVDIGGDVLIDGDLVITSGGIYQGGIIAGAQGVSGLSVDCDLLSGFGACVLGTPTASTYVQIDEDGVLTFVGNGGKTASPTGFYDVASGAYAFRSTAGVGSSAGLLFNSESGASRFAFLDTVGREIFFSRVSDNATYVKGPLLLGDDAGTATSSILHNVTSNDFEFATTTAGGHEQFPFLVAGATTTGRLDFARVAVGTTTIGAAGLQDQLYVAGRINSSWANIQEHFLGGITLTADTNNVVDTFGFRFDEDGVCTFDTKQSVAGGVARMTTGETNGNGCHLHSGDADNVATANNPVVEIDIRVDSTTSHTIYAGFADRADDDTGGDPTNGVYFLSESGNWHAITRSSDTETDTNTGIAPKTSTEFQKLRIEAEAAEVRFYIDNILVATHTANIPSAAIEFDVFNEATAGSVARDVFLKYVKVWVDDPPGGGVAESASDGDLEEPGKDYDVYQSAITAQYGVEEDPQTIPTGTVMSHSFGGYAMATEDLIVEMSQVVGDNAFAGIAIFESEHDPQLRLGDGSIDVAIAGRALVRTSTANGAIEEGDLLTSSEIPGLAVKASVSGMMIGRALEAYSGSIDGTTILAEINPGFYEVTEEVGVVTDFVQATLAAASEISDMLSGLGDTLVQVTYGKMLAAVASIGDLFTHRITIVPDGELTVPSGANQIAGSGTILAGGSSVVIPNTKITLDSKVFVTPTYQTQYTLAVTDKVPGVSFTVRIPSVTAGDIPFDWFIVSSYPADGSTTTAPPPPPAGGGSGGSGGSGGGTPPPPPDITPPVIVVSGSASMTIEIDDVYIDDGATATDDVDGDVSIQSSGDVDTSVEGTYTITYTATDSAGNSASADRTVTVSDTSSGGGTGDPPSDTTPPVITINGSVSMSLEVGETYTDDGATATDDVDGDVSIQSSGDVDTSVEGTYTITYTATDSAGNSASADRIVEVVAPAPPQDTTPPVISMVGETSISLQVGDSYTDDGATATDDTDGDIPVETSGSVDTSNEGTYVITYTATDSAGNSASLDRTVVVSAPLPPPPDDESEEPPPEE